VAPTTCSEFDIRNPRATPACGAPDDGTFWRVKHLAKKENDKLREPDEAQEPIE
jgi:hypothetical protein